MSRKYIRVSEMLIVDSMMHLRSETPIQCRPPVAQSQLANRENVSGEPMEEQPQIINVVHHDMDTNIALETTVSSSKESNLPQALISSQFQRVLVSPQVARSSVNSLITPRPADTQFSQGLAMTQVTVPPHLRVTASFGYTPTPESLFPLASLYSRSHGTNFGIPRVVCRA